MRAIGLLSLIAAALAAASPRAASQYTPEECATIEHFLAELELPAFRAAWLHWQTLDRLAGQASGAAEAGARTQELIAWTLAQLGQADTPAAQRERLAARLEALRKRRPEIDTPALQVAQAYAEFAWLEQRFLRGAAGESPADELGELGAAFGRLRLRLEETAQALRAERERRLAAPTPPLNEDHAFQQLEGTLRQVAYVQGWCAYYAGAAQAEAGHREFRWAGEHFRDLLQLNADQDLTQLQPDWLELDLPIIARAFLGLALAEQALERDVQAAACFQLLADLPTHASVREELPPWRWNSFYLPGQYARLGEWLDGQALTGARDVRAPPLALLQGSAGAVAARARAEGEAGGPATRLWNRIAERLAEAGAIEPLETLLQSQPELAATLGDAGLRRELQARASYRAAEAGGDPAAWAEAEVALQRLIAEAVDRPPESLAQWRFMLGSCFEQRGSLVAAAREFRAVARGAAGFDRELADQAAWRAVQTLQALEDPGPEAERWIEQTLRRAADPAENSRWAAEAQWELRRRQAGALSDEEAIRLWESVEPDDPHWLRAQGALIDRLGARWLERLGRGETQGRTAAEPAAVDEAAARDDRRRLEAAVARVLDAGQVEVLPPARLRTLLAWSDLLRRGAPEETELRSALLERAAAWSEAAGEDRMLQAHLQRQRLEIAVDRSDADDGVARARWLAEQAPAGADRQRGWMFLAEEYDRRVAAAGDDQRRAAVEEAYAFYGRLTEEWGTSPDVLRASPQAALALARRAEHAAELGHIAEAESHYQQLLAAQPDRLPWLLGSARNRMAGGDFARAAEQWRQIVRGVEAGSEEWLEAKWNLVRCLMESNPLAAEALRQQTLLLAPRMPARWRERLQQPPTSGLDQDASDGR